MTGEMLENGPHNFVYRHGLRATISHFGYYALAFYGTLSSALLLLFQFKPHGYQVWTLVTLYVSALGMSLLLAGVMTYRRLRTNVVVIG